MVAEWEVVTGPAYGDVAELVLDHAFDSAEAAQEAVLAGLDEIVAGLDELSDEEIASLRNGSAIAVDSDDDGSGCDDALIVVQPRFLLG